MTIGDSTGNENFLNLVGAETEMALRSCLGEHALLLEPSTGSPERNLARFYTASLLTEQRTQRPLNRTFDIKNKLTTAEELIAALDDTRFTTTDSDLMPGHPRTDENPLHVPLVSICELATSGTSTVPVAEISRASTLLLNEIDMRIHPKTKMGRLSSFFQGESTKAAMEAEFAEAKMLDRIIQASTNPSTK